MSDIGAPKPPYERWSGGGVIRRYVFRDSHADPGSPLIRVVTSGSQERAREQARARAGAEAMLELEAEQADWIDDPDDIVDFEDRR